MKPNRPALTAAITLALGCSLLSGSCDSRNAKPKGARQPEQPVAEAGTQTAFAPPIEEIRAPGEPLIDLLDRVEHDYALGLAAVREQSKSARRALVGQMEALGEQAVQAGDNAAAERIYKAILAADFWNKPARGYLAAFNKLEDAIAALPVPKYAVRDLPVEQLRIYDEIGGSSWTWFDHHAQFGAEGQFPFTSGVTVPWAPFDFFRAIIRHHTGFYDIFEFDDDFKTYRVHSLGLPQPVFSARRIEPLTLPEAGGEDPPPSQSPLTLDQLIAELGAEEDLAASQIANAQALYAGNLERIAVAAGGEGDEDAATHAHTLLFECAPANIRARAYLGLKNLIAKNRQFIPAQESAADIAYGESLKLHAWLLGTQWGWADISMSFDGGGFIHFANGHRSRWAPFGDRTVMIQHESEGSFAAVVFDKTMESYQCYHLGHYKPMPWHGNGTRLTDEEAAKLVPPN